jgi:hypothetical protein
MLQPTEDQRVATGRRRAAELSSDGKSKRWWQEPPPGDDRALVATPILAFSTIVVYNYAAQVPEL